MSKTVGNVVDPYEVVNKYGLEPVRYYLLSQIPLADDGDFTEERFREVYNADLANSLGNVVSRVAKLAEKVAQFDTAPVEQFRKNKHLEEFRFDEALRTIWGWISGLDQIIENDKPWKLEGGKLESVLVVYVKEIKKIATGLQPFLPQTAEKILKQFTGSKIKAGAPLFPRIK
jgi:methionyl-tRNA synthetase